MRFMNVGLILLVLVPGVFAQQPATVVFDSLRDLKRIRVNVVFLPDPSILANSDAAMRAAALKRTEDQNARVTGLVLNDLKSLGVEAVPVGDPKQDTTLPLLFVSLIGRRLRIDLSEDVRPERDPAKKFDAKTWTGSTEKASQASGPAEAIQALLQEFAAEYRAANAVTTTKPSASGK